MSQDLEDSSSLLNRIITVVRHYWGFDTLRPLQEQAIRAGLEQRDSLVVLPTGGGKSLCYQVPAVLADRTDVVVSPLIALMKDQVDGLRECGYPTAALHGNLSAQELCAAEERVASGQCRLVYVAPERLLTSRMLRLLNRVNVRSFAIDEAHCISHWGHDFRPEYRKLASLKERFPQASLHAYTATATQQVRDDIVQQLRLRDPTVLVGNFDRPNLVYRVVPRVDEYRQVLAVLERHKGQAAIVYCLSRKNTEAMADELCHQGISAACYHAGMDAQSRRRTQDAFAEEKLDVVAATVAFGMGIDRSNVRCVIHATMPKSIEHYQQETGRAGRDGLEAECVLLYSAADVIRWERLIQKSANEGANKPAEVIAAATGLLRQMRYFAAGMRCRHKALSEYFGQIYDREDCGACDVCLKEFEETEDSALIARKILSCVARVDQRFGAGHVSDVLIGANTEQIRRFAHERLSTYGLIKDTERKTLMNLIHQLVDQEVLVRIGGDRPILQLNEASWRVMRGQQQIRLLSLKTAGFKKSRVEKESWRGIDQGLFESLRTLRKEIAGERGVPTFVIFGDRTLREMARARPGSKRSFIDLHGIGRKKTEELGDRFVEHIAAYCHKHNLSLDTASDSRPHGLSQTPRNATLSKAIEMFAAGASIEEVMTRLGRARSTTVKYLTEYILHHRPGSIERWVDADTYQRVATAAAQTGADRLKPTYDKLEGRIPYDTIRLVARHLESKGR